MDWTNMEALSAGIQIMSVFYAPVAVYEVIGLVNKHTNLLRRKYRIMNTRHMIDPGAYLGQFEISKCGRFGYKTRREVGAASRRSR